MSKKGVDISFIKPAMDNDDWKREVTDVEKCLVIVEVYSSKWGACVHLDGHYQALYYDKVPLRNHTQLGAILSHSAQFLTPHAPPQAESLAIKFVRAQADNIGMLKEYKDQSKPVFLLFLDKTEKEKIEGPNLPELRKQISALAPPAVE